MATLYQKLYKKMEDFGFRSDCKFNSENLSGELAGFNVYSNKYEKGGAWIKGVDFHSQIDNSDSNLHTQVIIVESNIGDFFEGKDKEIKPDAKIKLSNANMFYRLFALGCKEYSEERITNHGFDLQDVVPLQTALCAIYRKNGHETSKYFYQYLKMKNNDFILNDCYNCAESVKENCKLRIAQLDNGR